MTPHRSVLFLPASNARAIAKAASLPADIVVLDLEDAVAPDAKAAARVAAVAAAPGFGARAVIRVNAGDTRWGADDLAAVAATGAAVLLPKVTGPGDIARVATALPGRPVWAMVETCAAVGALFALAAAPGLAAMVVGANDLALEMRARPGADRAELLPILSLAVAAARAHGRIAIDAVCNDYSDLGRVSAECAQGRRLGFDGKSLIHPAQIAAANAAFGPDPAEVERARAIVAAFSAPDAAGQGAIGLHGRMIERLHLAEAERTLALAAACA
jgi:citrate lyase subunit beta / citryl-CoA lyase